MSPKDSSRQDAGGGSDHSFRAALAAAERPWRTPRLPRVVGIKGACAILGVHKTTLNHWLEPGSGPRMGERGLGPDETYMIPPIRVWDGVSDDPDGWPIWDAADIEHFAEKKGRIRAPVGQAKPRRPRSPEALRDQIAALERQLAAAEAKQT